MATKPEENVFKDRYKDNWEYDRIITGRKEYPDSHRLSFELNKFNDEQLKVLSQFAKRNHVDSRTLNSIQRWVEAIDNPKDSPVPSLPAMKQMFASVMSENMYKWIFRESPDGFMLPYLVTGVEYTPPSKFSSEHTTIQLKCGTYYSNHEFTGEDDKAEYETPSVNFNNGHLYENEDELLKEDIEFDKNNMYDFDDVENDDDDDEENTQSKKSTKSKLKPPPKKKKTYKKLMQILADRNIFMPTDEALELFFKHARTCYDLSSKMGHQFICTGKAYMKQGWSSSVYNMNEEGSHYRLVVDMKGIPEGAERQSKAIFGQGLIPFHPYIRCYNLTKYCFCDVHAALLKEYEYDDGIINNMIVTDRLKNYLNKIIGGQNVFTDIVKGKSGGMIILASGIAGVGKTLTAEVYSEKMHLPLYSIQASQLGITVEKIEEKLVKALKRAERWGAVLLIDECDTYLRKRANDLEQNAIVGIWLRLLEYFNGIMFLTTNIHDQIDDAILSRCSSHIKYEAPNKKELCDIIKVHCRVQGIDISPSDAKTISENYKMTGRDVRNMLKNIKKCFAVTKGKIVLKPEMIDQLKDFIPFIN
jgi:hypothetical protein